MRTEQRFALIYTTVISSFALAKAYEVDSGSKFLTLLGVILLISVLMTWAGIYK